MSKQTEKSTWRQMFQMLFLLFPLRFQWYWLLLAGEKLGHWATQCPQKQQVWRPILNQIPQGRLQAEVLLAEMKTQHLPKSLVRSVPDIRITGQVIRDTIQNRDSTGISYTNDKARAKFLPPKSSSITKTLFSPPPIFTSNFLRREGLKLAWSKSFVFYHQFLVI